MKLNECDYARQPLTAAELALIFAADDVAPFLNIRHATYKERGWSAQLPAAEELYRAILAEPNLLRRPVTRRGKQVVIGFDEEKLHQLLINA